MKSVFKVVLLVSSFLVISNFTRAQINLSELNQYWTLAKPLVQQGKLINVNVDNNTISLLDRVVPRASAAGLSGLVEEVANILYEKKNIKYLDPNFRVKLYGQCNSLQQTIKGKDVLSIAVAVYNLGTFIYEFVNSAEALECETNNTATIILINTSNNPYDIYLNGTLLRRVSGKSQTEKITIAAGENQKLYAKQVSGFLMKPTEKFYTVNIATCTTNNSWSFPN